MKLISVNCSENKEGRKKPVEIGTVTLKGLLHDAHAGIKNLEISLIDQLDADQFGKKHQLEIYAGDFGENLTTYGINTGELAPLDQLEMGEVILEITRIGKKCDDQACAVFNATGECLMPEKGIFARVIKGGLVTAEMEIKHLVKMTRVLIVTLSDRASAGEYEDISGPMLKNEVLGFLEAKKRKCHIDLKVMPDEATDLMSVLNEYAEYDLIFTTGSTGIGPRDMAPDVASQWIEKEIPGIMDHIRLKYGTEKPGALISRSIAGVKGKTQLYALPGSPKAIKEYTSEIFKTLQHIMYMLHNLDIH